MQWFRMYGEAVDDEKLRLLAFEDRWHFVALLCLKAQGVLDDPNEELRKRKISIKLGLDSVELETVMKRLVTVGLVSKEGQPKNWNKRQYVSDSSTSRVRKHRETLQKRSRNGPDTETEAETDTESERSDSSSPSNSIRQSSSFNSSGPDDLKVVPREKNALRIAALAGALAQQKRVLR